jgi:hypothetical protein
VIHIAPIVAPISNTTLACSVTTTTIVFSGTGTPGALITLKNASGAVVSTATVGTGGAWATPALIYASGSYSVTAESLYTNAVLIGNTVSFIVSAATNCNPIQLAPVISPVSSFPLSCTEASRSITLSGTGTP